MSIAWRAILVAGLAAGEEATLASLTGLFQREPERAAALVATARTRATAAAARRAARCRHDGGLAATPRRFGERTRGRGRGRRLVRATQRPPELTTRRRARFAEFTYGVPTGGGGRADGGEREKRRRRRPVNRAPAHRECGVPGALFLVGRVRRRLIKNLS